MFDEPRRFHFQSPWRQQQAARIETGTFMINILDNLHGDDNSLDLLLDQGLSNRLTVVVGLDADERDKALNDWLERREYEAIQIHCPTGNDMRACTRSLYDRFSEAGITDRFANDDPAGEGCLPRLVRLMNSLAELRRDLVVIFRDYQSSEHSDRVLSFMLDHLPQQVHLYLSCDSVPCLNCIPRLRVRRQLQTIDTSQA